MSDPESDDLWKVNDKISIEHIETSCKLHSHDILLDDGRQEVTCFDGSDDNDKVGRIHAINLQFITCLIELFNQSYSGK